MKPVAYSSSTSWSYEEFQRALWAIVTHDSPVIFGRNSSNCWEPISSSRLVSTHKSMDKLSTSTAYWRCILGTMWVLISEIGPSCWMLFLVQSSIERGYGQKSFRNHYKIPTYDAQHHSLDIRRKKPSGSQAHQWMARGNKHHTSLLLCKFCWTRKRTNLL